VSLFAEISSYLAGLKSLWKSMFTPYQDDPSLDFNLCHSTTAG